MNLGIITDQGLLKLSELLKANSSLEEITFSETSDHQKYWSEKSKKSFTAMMENNTNIRRVKLYFAREDQEADKEFE